MLRRWCNLTYIWAVGTVQNTWTSVVYIVIHLNAAVWYLQSFIDCISQSDIQLKPPSSVKPVESVPSWKSDCNRVAYPLGYRRPKTTLYPVSKFIWFKSPEKTITLIQNVFGVIGVCLIGYLIKWNNELISVYLTFYKTLTLSNVYGECWCIFDKSYSVCKRIAKVENNKDLKCSSQT